MKKIILSLLAFVIIINSYAQEQIDINNFDFGKIPTLTEAEDAFYKPYKAVYLQTTNAIEYIINSESVALINFQYYAVKIYDKDVAKDYEEFVFGEEKNNILKLKIRTSRDGNILHTYSMNDLTNVENIDEETFEIVSNWIIRIEDLAPGTTLEMFYIVDNPNINIYFTEYLQNKYPQISHDYSIIAPIFLDFDLIAYNSDVEASNIVDEDLSKRFISAHFENLPPTQNEPLSYNNHLVRLEGCLSYNYTQGKMRINSHASYAENAYTNLSAPLDKTISKTIDKKFIKAQKISTKTESIMIAKAFDEWFKTNIYIFPFSEIEDVFRSYIYIFNKCKIDYELMVSCDKTKKIFDKKFKGQNFFEDIIFYLPKYDYYIFPIQLNHINSLIPEEFFDNDALVLTPIKVGKDETYTYNYRKIPTPESALNTDSTIVDLKFDLSNNISKGTIYRSLMGYSALNYQAYFTDFEQEDYEYMIESLLGAGSEQTVVSNEKIMNSARKDIAINPFILTGNISSADWIRLSQKKIFFNFGKIFGEQFKFDDDKKRINPINISSKKSIYRKITFEIPEKYTITNLSALNIEVYDTDDASTAQAGFTSTYSVEGNKVTVICHEFYNRLFYPVEEFESIKKIYNASADYYYIQLEMIQK